jgi:hypothetical protein
MCRLDRLQSMSTSKAGWSFSKELKQVRLQILQLHALLSEGGTMSGKF